MGESEPRPWVSKALGVAILVAVAAAVVPYVTGPSEGGVIGEPADVSVFHRAGPAAPNEKAWDNATVTVERFKCTSRDATETVLSIVFKVSNTGKRELDWDLQNLVVVDEGDRQFVTYTYSGEKKEKTGTFINCAPGETKSATVWVTIPTPAASGSLRLGIISSMALETIQAPILLKNVGELAVNEERTSLQ